MSNNEKHPMQPIIKAEKGYYDKEKEIQYYITRFKENKIVRFLLDAGPFDLNQLALMNFSLEDMIQFYQQIGYSTSGFGDIFHEKAPDVVEEVDKLSDVLTKKITKEI
jgi:hypothetical protein